MMIMIATRRRRPQQRAEQWQLLLVLVVATLVQAYEHTLVATMQTLSSPEFFTSSCFSNCKCVCVSALDRRERKFVCVFT